MADTTFNIEIDNLDQIQSAFKDAPEKVGPLISKAIAQSADILAKYTVPGIVPYKTGFLIQTFQREVSDMTARWFPTRAYAPFVEFGTPPHIILPINKKALFWKGATNPVKSVHHPGTRPNPFMERIMTNAKDDIQQTFKQVLSAIGEQINET
jgi:hypothetical protein